MTKLIKIEHLKDAKHKLGVNKASFQEFKLF